MNVVEEWRYETIGKEACEALRRSGFDALFVSRGAKRRWSDRFLRQAGHEGRTSEDR